MHSPARISLSRCTSPCARVRQKKNGAPLMQSRLAGGGTENHLKNCGKNKKGDCSRQGIMQPDSGLHHTAGGRRMEELLERGRGGSRRGAPVRSKTPCSAAESRTSAIEDLRPRMQCFRAAAASPEQAASRSCARHAFYTKTRGSGGRRCWRCSRTPLAMLLWLYCLAFGIVPSVRSVPPHQRACPGPIDRQVGAGACSVQGRATLSDKAVRRSGGVRSTGCQLQSGILKCLVRLSAGTVVVPVYRDGGFAGAGSVSYSTAAGTARSGVEFHARSGSIHWDSFRVRDLCRVECFRAIFSIHPLILRWSDLDC